MTVLPYNGSSGWSGSATSRERARGRDSSGLTGRNQQMALWLIGDAGVMGLTWRELGLVTGWHHGTASGVLSNLHAGGRVARLRLSRDRCRVYVLPGFVSGREVEEQGRVKRCPHCNEVI